MKTITENSNQLSLFSDILGQEFDYKNDCLTYIDTSSNNSNVVHKKNATSNFCKTAKTSTNNIKKQLNDKNSTYRIAKNQDNLEVDCELARGLTWSDDTIDKAYARYSKLYPDCVIVKVSSSRLVSPLPHSHNGMSSLR